jgi:hypothetical protein
MIPSPESSLKILTPTDENELPVYTYNNHRVRHRFCPKCGIKCYLTGEFSMQGNVVKFARINVLTVDGREDGGEMEDLRKFKIKYFDGLTDNFGKGLADEPAEGGIA